MFECFFDIATTTHTRLMLQYTFCVTNRFCLDSVGCQSNKSTYEHIYQMHTSRVRFAFRCFFLLYSGVQCTYYVFWLLRMTARIVWICSHLLQFDLYLLCVFLVTLKCNLCITKTVQYKNVLFILYASDIYDAPFFTKFKQCACILQ